MSRQTIKNGFDRLKKWFEPRFEDVIHEQKFVVSQSDDGYFLKQATAIGIIAHWIYAASLSLTNSNVSLFSYIVLFGVQLPMALFVAGRYLTKVELSNCVSKICDWMVAFYSVIWATGSILLSLLCTQIEVGSSCSNPQSRPIFIGLVFYATFGVLVSLLIFKINRLIMATVVFVFSAWFLAVWIYIDPKPYILLLPTFSFYIYAFILAHTQDISERTKFKLYLDLQNELVTNKQFEQQQKQTFNNSKQFVNYVFHELRVNLNTVSLNWEMLEGELIEKHYKNSEQNDILSSIKIGLDGLEIILNDVLDIRKIQEGKFSLSNQPFDINKTVKNIQSTMLSGCVAKNIELTLDLDKKIDDLEFLLLGDEARLRQVVTNFLSNAQKFTPVGGKIQISTQLTKANENQNHCAEIYLAVTDNGIGISKENQTKLFKNFSQVHASNAAAELNGLQNIKGTGLGLAIISSIVSSYNGTFGVISSENSGSTFWFKILFQLTTEKRQVLEKLTSSEKAKSRQIMSSSIKKLNILVADDSLPTRKIMSKVMQNLGHSCTTVEDGLQALNLINSPGVSFDLLISDSHMPNLDGQGLIKTLRNQHFSLPIIVLTGSISSFEEEKQFIKLGANASLIKPVKAETLDKMIKNVMKLNFTNVTAKHPEDMV